MSKTSILEATDGRGVDNSCEFFGAASALSNAIHSTRMGGYVNILSVYGQSMPEVPMNEVVPLSSPQRHQRQENVVHLGHHARPACKRCH